MTRLLFAVFLLATLVACGSAGGSEGGSETPATDEAPFELNDDPEETTAVTAIKSYTFEPAVIEVETGAEVTWSNEDDFPHNVHFLAGRDETYDLPIGEEAAVTFDEAGEFYYECSIHPQQMRGKVIVTG